MLFKLGAIKKGIPEKHLKETEPNVSNYISECHVSNGFTFLSFNIAIFKTYI